MSNRILFTVQGYSYLDNLWFRPGSHRCGSINDGVAFAHDNDGEWILSFTDLEKMYELAKAARASAETPVALKPSEEAVTWRCTICNNVNPDDATHCRQCEYSRMVTLHGKKVPRVGRL